MDIKQYVPTICICLLCFAGGCLTGVYFSQGETVTVEKNVPVYLQGETKTEIAYVPKIVKDGQTEKTDMETNIGKTDFVIKVNGQEQTFEKSDDEQYMFEKNKLTLDQTSKVSLDVNVPTWDKTKRWAVGVGYGENGMAYTADFPIGKSNTYAGWAYKDNDSTAVGIKVRF